MVSRSRAGETGLMGDPGLHARARACLQQGRLQEALGIYAGLCRQWPEDADAWFLRGAVAGRLGDFRLAVECGRRAVELRPAHVEAWFNLGLALRETGALGEALDAFRAALRLQSSNEAIQGVFRATAHEAVADQVLRLRLRGDVVIRVPASLQLQVPYSLLEQEDWFEDEIAFVRALVRPGMQALDIGANYGVYALTMARRLGPEGRLWAFEPASATAAWLRCSLRDNGFSNIEVVEAALSDHEGTAWLSLDDNAELNALAKAPAGGDTEAVRLTTLDDCAARQAWRDISFVKLDAEGEELAIVRGGRQFFREQSPLVMFELRHGKTPNLGLIEAFAGLGYQSYRLMPGLGLLVPCDPGQPLDPYQLNLFCCKPDRAAELEGRGLLARHLATEALGAGEGDWREHLHERPYAAALRDRWEADDGQTPPAEWQRVLALHARAQDGGAAPTVRAAALVQATELARKAAQARPLTSRLHTLARLASMAGQRALALQALGDLADRPAVRPEDLGEPFLVASERFDRIDPRQGGGLEAWCRAAVLEERQRLKYLSPFGAGPGELPALEELLGTGLAAPWVERRYQLIRMRHGLQEGPQSRPALAERHEANLNPEYWT